MEDKNKYLSGKFYVTEFGQTLCELRTIKKTVIIFGLITILIQILTLLIMLLML